MWDAPVVAAVVVTVRVKPYEPGPAGPHIATSAIAEAGGHDVIVMANDARTDVSCWGGC